MTIELIGSNFGWVNQYWQNQLAKVKFAKVFLSHFVLYSIATRFYVYLIGKYVKVDSVILLEYVYIVALTTQQFFTITAHMAFSIGNSVHSPLKMASWYAHMITRNFDMPLQTLYSNIIISIT